MPPLAAADVLAIERLYARYNHAIGHADGAAWAECFTEDATFSNRHEQVTGRPALERYGAEFSAATSARYWVSNLLLERSGDGVRGTCYLVILHVGKSANPPRISLTGIYDDVIVLEQGEWRFARRHIARARSGVGYRRAASAWWR